MVHCRKPSVPPSELAAPNLGPFRKQTGCRSTEECSGCRLRCFDAWIARPRILDMRCEGERDAISLRTLDGRNRGEQKQAVGRSRGGRNTKIHAIADAKGRLLSILLTGGEAHDCPPAQRLIRRSKIAKKLLGDRAYDSAELRQWLSDRGTKPVIPNKSNRKQPFSFNR